jgi:predicted nucleic acid-binding protein
MNVFIDTEIWIFAQKIPDIAFFQDESEYRKALQFHQKSSEFLKNEIMKSEISMTIHQLCEIFHALTYRGKKSPKNFALTYCKQLLNSSFMHWYQVLDEHVIKAIEYSEKSGIHIWDYICVIPLFSDVDILYSCDEHYNHTSFQSLGPKVENPLGIWITL